MILIAIQQRMTFLPNVSQLLGMKTFPSDAISVKLLMYLARSDIEQNCDGCPTFFTEVINTFPARVIFLSGTLDLWQISFICSLAISKTFLNASSAFPFCWSSFVAQSRKAGLFTLLQIQSMCTPILG